MEISVPAKVGIVLLIVCLLLRLKPIQTIIILVTHYMSHKLIA